MKHLLLAAALIFSVPIGCGAAAPAWSAETAPICAHENKAEAYAALAEEPANHILAELGGKDATAFLEAIGAPVEDDDTFLVIIADIPSTKEAALVVVISDQGCVIGAGPIPMPAAVSLLHRTSA